MTVGFDDVVAAVAAAAAVEPVGARTHAEVADPVRPGAVPVAAPRGIVAHDAGDLTLTVLGGTPCGEVDTVLAAHGQFVPLDPRDPSATVAGTLASGLSGVRRLGYGPLRDSVLEVRVVTGAGVLVKGGGPTVKNVTGYDLPRLMVGSLGTLGVLVQVTLRCRPRPLAQLWLTTPAVPADVLARLFRPKAVLHDGRDTFVLLEGSAAEIDAERANAGLAGARELDCAPPLPEGSHRGRISLAPGVLRDCAIALDRESGLTWTAEWGVGTIHVAADDPGAVLRARAIATAHGGWMLREAGLPGVDGLGVPVPNLALHERVRRAFDPDGKLAPGRLPALGEPVVAGS
jgi:glycolate oxidase FAD binding subunit